LSITCTRCRNAGEPPPARRVAFPPRLKERILSSICDACWQEWEGVEVKVINEYRLNFMDPRHREQLARAGADFLGVGADPLA
jgi:Fe-S cluster biosynthesis and repair protein YggX